MSIKSNRDQDVQFIKNLMHNVNAKMNVSQLCRVVSFSNDDHSKVNVQPLPHNQSGSKRPMLLNVHVGRLLRSELVVGDVVVVLFLDRSIENWDGSNRDFIITNTRMHNVNDAFVIEVF